MDALIFLYGTLRTGCAPREIAQAAVRLVSVGTATIRARAYDLGAYPGALLDDTATLRGEVFRVPDGVTLAELDSYEDFRAHDLTGSLFLRVEAVAAMDDGTAVPCWVYVYNGDLRVG